LGKLEGDGGHLRLAGHWLKLHPAEDSWELRDLLEERLTRQGALLKGASLDGWMWDAGKLNRLLLDGEWLGQAGLDHLLGNAHLVGLLVDNVLHASWDVQDRDVLIQLGHWGWDHDLTWALGGFTDEFFLEGGREARAALEASFGSRLVQHEREGSQTWPKDAHAWGLQVSSALTVHVTAKANSTGLQELWGNNLNHRSVGQDHQALPWDVDLEDIVLVTQENQHGLAFRVLLDQTLTNSWEGKLLTIDHNLHGTSDWDHLNLSDTRQDLDNLVLSLI